MLRTFFSSSSLQAGKAEIVLSVVFARKGVHSS